MNCTEKFLKHSERVGARFAESNAGAHSFNCLAPFNADIPSQSKWVPGPTKPKSTPMTSRRFIALSPISINTTPLMQEIQASSSLLGNFTKMHTRL